MKRLQAAEDSIKTCEDVIKSERDLRKQTSKELKQEMVKMRQEIDLEKKTIQERVTIQLDTILKQAAREKVEIQV